METNDFAVDGGPVKDLHWPWTWIDCLLTKTLEEDEQNILHVRMLPTRDDIRSVRSASGRTPGKYRLRIVLLAAGLLRFLSTLTLRERSVYSHIACQTASP